MFKWAKSWNGMLVGLCWSDHQSLLTLMTTSSQVVKSSVTVSNSPFRDYICTLRWMINYLIPWNISRESRSQDTHFVWHRESFINPLTPEEIYARPPPISWTFSAFRRNKRLEKINTMRSRQRQILSFCCYGLFPHG